jgi:hypothetical protein
MPSLRISIGDTYRGYRVSTARLSASRKLKCEPIVQPVFRSNAKGSLRVDLSTRLAIVEPVIELIGRPPRRSIIAGSWMRGGGINLDPTGRRHGARGAGAGAGAKQRRQHLN